jgi:hypothetical protein
MAYVVMTMSQRKYESKHRQQARFQMEYAVKQRQQVRFLMEPAGNQRQQAKEKLVRYCCYRCVNGMVTEG